MIENLIADKVAAMPPSGIRKFFDIANEMKGAISLGVGEPDFETPWHIREEGIYTLEKGRTVYTANAGLLELRKEICSYLKRRCDLEYEAKSQVLVTVGASEGIDVALRTVINPGEEVIVIEPSYVSYKPCIVLAGGVPVIINTKAENQFRLTAQEVWEAITPKTKAIILPYPNNPTGAIMEKEDLEKVAEVLRDKNILVISDEIYSELTYSGKHVSIASIDGMYEKTVVLNGFSKAYAMTGWRLGYAAGPKEIIKQMTKVHQYAIMCAPTTSQYAAIEALRNGDSDVEEMVKSYIRSNILSGFLAPFASLLLNVATVAIIYFSSKHISYQSAFTAGDVIACVQYIGLILNGLIVLSWGLVLIPHVFVSSKRVRQVLELKGAESSDKKGEVLNGDLKIENLSFHYPDGSDELVLEGITMSVKNGEKVGVIGGTGSGKSTLIKLLCGFYSPTSGNIYLGNKNYNSLDIADIRQSVSVALQKAMIFQGTLKENVTAFNDSVPDEEVQKIIEIAQLKEFVNEKEGGLYHELKQSGSNLSGGQKQRVNIARTIFKNASLYVFDDSFSALDYLTESKLRKRLNEFLAGKKQLIITQRIATAMKCDRIYVFDGGKCVNAGTHNELLNSSEIYRELYRSQLGAKV